MSYAAFTAAASAHPAALLPAPPATTLRGNPNLARAPAAASAPAPAAPAAPPRSTKLCCRMHGGRSPGPGTPESLPQAEARGPYPGRDARTIHGNDSANASADNRHRLTLLRISRVDVALHRYQARLPPAPSANCPLQGAPMPGPTAPFKPSRTDPLNREPDAVPGPER
jgi:hypothetical protein